MRKPWSHSEHRGSIIGPVAVSLIVLIGAGMVGVDFSRVVLTGVRTQRVADEAARAAVRACPSASYSAAYQRISEAAAQAPANDYSISPISCSPAETVFYQAGCKVPGYGSLIRGDEAATVGAHAEVKLYFSSLLVSHAKVSVTKQATGVRRSDGSVKIVR